MYAEREAAGITPAGAAFTDLILATFRLNGRLISAGDRLTRDLGLSSSRWQVMYAVSGGALPAAQIARHMGLTRQSVQRTVDLLAAEELVAFEDNPYHQRARLVRLTAKGEALLQEVSRRQGEWAGQVAAGLAPHELQGATRLLENLRQRLDAPAAGVVAGAGAGAEEEGHD